MHPLAYLISMCEGREQHMCPNSIYTHSLVSYVVVPAIKYTGQLNIRYIYYTLTDEWNACVAGEAALIALLVRQAKGWSVGAAGGSKTTKKRGVYMCTMAKHQKRCHFVTQKFSNALMS